MIQAIVFCIVAVAAITALFFAWYFYQQAQNKERMFLLKKGVDFEDILKAQKENRFKFSLPWLKLGIITISTSISFLIIALIIRFRTEDEELFTGFLITFTIGICLSVALFVIHLIDKKRNS